jgi:hypothetical protein
MFKHPVHLYGRATLYSMNGQTSFIHKWHEFIRPSHWPVNFNIPTSKLSMAHLDGLQKRLSSRKLWRRF